MYERCSMLKCQRVAEYQIDGQFYCKWHDPKRLAERQKNIEAIREQYRQDKANEDFHYDLLRRAGVVELNDEDLQAIIQAGGIQQMLKNIKVEKILRYTERNGPC